MIDIHRQRGCPRVILEGTGPGNECVRWLILLVTHDWAIHILTNTYIENLGLFSVRFIVVPQTMDTFSKHYTDDKQKTLNSQLYSLFASCLTSCALFLQDVLTNLQIAISITLQSKWSVSTQQFNGCCAWCWLDWVTQGEVCLPSMYDIYRVN